MNTIFIHDLRIETRIGIYDWERRLPQTVRLDLDVALPSMRPFETGEFADAVDYAAIVSRIKSFASGDPPPLLERFAEAIARILLDEFHAPSVRVRVAKLAPITGVREIGVMIERQAETKG